MKNTIQLLTSLGLPPERIEGWANLPNFDPHQLAISIETPRFRELRGRTLPYRATDYAIQLLRDWVLSNVRHNPRALTLTKIEFGLVEPCRSPDAVAGEVSGSVILSPVIEHILCDSFDPSSLITFVLDQAKRLEEWR